MTIYECDFCKEQKACKKMMLNDMEYDICKSCESKLQKKLEGRGTKRLQYQPVHWIYSNGPLWPYYTGNWPMVVTPVYTPITPTITWGNNVQGMSGGVTSGNVGTSNYVLTGDIGG